MVKERPILFSGPMVTAILEGRKTQTRRVIKPQPIVALYVGNYPTFQCTGFKFHSPGYTASQLVQFCPYGQVRDKLWVKETWAVHSAFPIRTEGNYLTIKYRASESDKPKHLDYSLRWDVYDKYAQKKYRGWQPSIFMPRWASRITLEITGIRVQRLQEISGEDAEAEGCQAHHEDCHPIGPLYVSAKSSLETLWDSINSKKHPWESNPWVWAIEFKRIEHA